MLILYTMNYCRIKQDVFDISTLLTKEEIDSLELKSFKKGEILYYSQNIELLIFKKGKAKSVLYDNGRSFTLCHILKNNFYLQESNSTIEFLEDSEIYFVHTKIFSKLFENKLFCNAVMYSMAKSIELERRILQDLVFDDSRHRVITFFLDSAHTIGKKQIRGILIDIAMPISELASFLASTRQTVSTVINELIAKKIIYKVSSRKYIITDIEKLKNY